MIMNTKTIVCGLFLAIPAFCQIVVTDDNWTSMTGPNGLGAFPLVVDKKGTLYAGGRDTTSNAKGMLVARWNGSAWDVVCRGINNMISAMAIDDSDNIYIGGSFDTAGGVKANHIARWNGAVWKTLGSGINGNISLLAIDHSGNLFAGGKFDNAGGIKITNIAQWNGISWNALDSNRFGEVKSLAIGDSGKLFVCFAFAIAKWDGKTWTKLMDLTCTGICVGNSVLTDKSGALYVGGSLGVTNFVCVERLNGSSWSTLGTGPWSGIDFPYVSMLGLDSSGNLYAAGHFYKASNVSASNIARWDGNSWSPLGTGLYNKKYIPGLPDVNALAIDNLGNLYVEGSFDIAGGKPTAGFARCDIKGTSAGSTTFDVEKKSIRTEIKAGNILFTLSKPSNISFMVFDNAGRKLLQHGMTSLTAGSHSVKFAVGNLRSGIYFLDFHASDISYKGKFSVMK
jgi:hypothetical protein